jgi:hypothetical protein
MGKVMAKVEVISAEDAPALIPDGATVCSGELCAVATHLLRWAPNPK